MKRTPLLLAAGVALALAFQGLVYWPSLSVYLADHEALWEGRPLLTTSDGYLFLRHARAALDGTFAPADSLRPFAEPAPLPLPSALAAGVSRATGLDLETVAFYLPPILASLMVFVCLGMGRALGSWPLGLLAFCFAAASPMRFYRTIPGSFDTDGLNQVLFWTALLFGYHLFRGGAARRAACLAGWALANVLLCLWWPQGGLSFVGLGVGFVLLGRALEQGWHRRTRYVLAAVGLAGLVGVAVLQPGLVPAVARAPFEQLHLHLILALGMKEAFYLPIGRSIVELARLPLSGAVSETTGNWLLFVLALAGGWQALRRSRAAAYFLLPGGFFFLVSFALGARFLMFAAPAYGLGLAWFLVRWLPERSGSSRTARALLAILVVLLLADASRPAWNYRIFNTEDRYTANLADVYRQRSEPGAKTWNWWGPGYFLQYFSQRPTFIDGGSQTDERTFVAAVPYAARNPVLARNWIKFFARHPEGIDQVDAMVHDRSRTIQFLLSALRQPARLEDFLHEFNMPRDAAFWRGMLYPRGTVYFVALNSMLYHGSWLSIGQWTPRNPTQFETTSFAYASAAINRAQGTVTLPDGKVVRYSRLYFVTPKALSHDSVRPDGDVAVLMLGVPYVFIIQPQHFDVVAFRLLFVGPESVPGFAPIAYHPYVGGVWKVE